MKNQGKDSGEKFTEGLDGLNKRLEEYDNKTKPLIIFYENQKKFYSIDGVGSLTDVNIRLVDIIDSKCNDWG